MTFELTLEDEKPGIWRSRWRTLQTTGRTNGRAPRREQAVVWDSRGGVGFQEGQKGANMAGLGGLSKWSGNHWRVSHKVIKTRSNLCVKKVTSEEWLECKSQSREAIVEDGRLDKSGHSGDRRMHSGQFLEDSVERTYWLAGLGGWKREESRMAPSFYGWATSWIIPQGPKLSQLMVLSASQWIFHGVP